MEGAPELEATPSPLLDSQEQQCQSTDQQPKGADHKGIKTRRSKGLGSTGGTPEYSSTKDQPMAADGCYLSLRAC